jgi:integrase
MPYLYLDKRKSPPIWRYQIWDHHGKRRSFTGTTSKRETQDMAQRRQLHENEIRDGIREAPQPKLDDHSFEEISNEWLEWGRIQGGKRGHPWNWMHYRKCKLYMSYWRETLKLTRMTDLANCLARVERALRALHSAKKSGKTINSYASALSAFCNWAARRKYLAANPIKDLQRFEQNPTFKRRALTSEEVQRLLAAAETHHYGRMRRLGYEIALSSGLRKNEIRSLRVKHLDLKRGGLVLENRWTKNRSDGFQPLPKTTGKRTG